MNRDQNNNSCKRTAYQYEDEDQELISPCSMCSSGVAIKSICLRDSTGFMVSIKHLFADRIGRSRNPCLFRGTAIILVERWWIVNFRVN